MTHSEKERNSEHGSNCSCKPNSKMPCSQVDFPKWLDQKLRDLEEKYDDFKTVNSIRQYFAR